MHGRIAHRMGLHGTGKHYFAIAGGLNNEQNNYTRSIAELAIAMRDGGDTLALALTYAAVPSALKLAAGLIVLLAPLPESISRDPTPPEKAPA